MTTGLHDPAKLRQLKFKLPYIGELTWEPDPTQRKAAWALYVELTTRIATQPLDLDHGLLREAMTSLHALFAVTRGILREAGPDVGSGPNTVGGVAIKVLNGAIRPYVAKWHPRLAEHEHKRPPDKSAREWERAWADEPTARGEHDRLRAGLIAYAAALAEMAGVRP